MAKNKMSKPPSEEDEREERIAMEIVVDAYGEEERAMGWYYYLQDRMTFPFIGICDTKRETSPLIQGERVEALELADEEVCQHEIFVRINNSRKKQRISVPLMQLAPTDDMDSDTGEALEDWRYWMNMGYKF